MTRTNDTDDRSIEERIDAIEQELAALRRGDPAEKPEWATVDDDGGAP